MKSNNRQILILFLSIAFLFSGATTSIHVSAKQRPQKPAQCPTTKVMCPDTVESGGNLVFSADVSGGDKNVMPTYNWTVSAGTISSGQGTSSIQVDTTGLAGDSTVTATVELGGYDRDCAYGSTVNSCTTTMLKKPEARKFDEYGNIQPSDENARLENYMIELNMDPTAKGYILAFASRAADAQKAATRVKDYLVKKLGLERLRALDLIGGVREQSSIELWIVPAGATPPHASPVTKPGDAKSSTPAKPKPATRKKS